MKKVQAYFLLCCLFASTQLIAQSYQKTNLGIKTTTQSMTVEIQFYSPTIVRVLRLPEGVACTKTSLSVIKLPEKTDLKIADDGKIVTITSNSIKLSYDLITGKVSYADLKGNALFSEKDYGTQFTPTLDVKKESFIARQAFLLDKDEAIYGLGQQQNGKLNQRGQRVTLKNENMKVGIPFFQSIKGYGVFWDNYASTLFTDNLQETSFESLGDNSDYYFMYGGSGDGVIAQMRDLTGQVPMLPLWSYGYFQSKERYKTQDELVGIVEKYRNLKVPIDGIIQDWQYWGRDSIWNAMSFDKKNYYDPKTMVDKIHNMKAHLMIVAWPGFGPLTDQYKEFSKNNMLIKFDTWPLNSGTTVYDPYNPQARDIYWRHLNKGVFSFDTDGWWLDSSEPDHFNQKEKDFDQPTHLGSYRSVVNAFPLQHVKGIYEHQRATTSDKRVLILTRSAFAGQQRYGANTWSGDIISSWKTLQTQIPAGLSFAITANPYWNADIGGFFLWEQGGSNALKEKTYHELYVRWIQFGTFTPMMRSHGTDAPREIYQFGKQGDWSYDAIEKFINFRYQLMPYIYSTAWDVTTNSASFMRPLFSDFASDKKVQDMTDEYLFGRSILVAPVLAPMYVTKDAGKSVENFSQIKTRKVYLPQGTEWVDFWTGEKLQGGQEVEKATPIDIIPLYVKAGSILPWGPKVQYAAEKKLNNLEIRVYPGANGEFTLYEDENDNYNYEKGLKSTITMKWDNASKTLTIGEREGSFTGMLKSRKFNIVLVDKQTGKGISVATKFNKTIVYTGQAKSVKL
jgi:alpha-D-xyloside xylohydrolase